MARNPTRSAEKWARNLAASVQDIEAGVNAVAVAPSQRAIASKAKMISKWNDAVNSGKWEQNLGRITLADWKRDMITKGLPRISQGASAAQPKMVTFLTELFTYQQPLIDQVKTMPNLTIEDSIQRMTFFVRGMAQFRRG